jgi:N-sulfoglucosamine sulfohydrolase
MPSVLELLGVTPPAGMDGRSWVPLLRGESQADRDHVITHVNTVSSGKSLPQRCIRTKDHSLMFHGWVGGEVPFRVEAMSGLSFAAMNAADDAKVRARVKQLVEGEPLMFFDLAADPTERVNRIDDPKYASEIAELSTGLLEAMRRTEDPQTEAFAAAIARWGQQGGR